MRGITKKRILEIINETIEDGRLTPGQYDEDLVELGMDSIRFIQIIVSLEEEYDCEVSDTKLLLSQMNTINKIYDVFTSIDSDV